jgi:hypothetical protein
MGDRHAQSMVSITAGKLGLGDQCSSPITYHTIRSVFQRNRLGPGIVLVGDPRPSKFSSRSR